MSRLDFQALVGLYLAIFASSGIYTVIIMSLVRLLIPMDVVVFRFVAGEGCFFLLY